MIFLQKTVAFFIVVAAFGMVVAEFGKAPVMTHTGTQQEMRK